MLLAAKGFCMGGADIIPGVSGGTIAFITGIYEDLLGAVRSVNYRFGKALVTGNLKEALAELHLRFLLPLLLGVGTAFVALAGLMHWLLNEHPVHIWSLFMGLIGASTIVVGRKVPSWNGATLTTLASGAVAAWFIVGMVPVTTPESWWFIFLCGMIAICAMILPGISGSFLLLILGKYEFVTGALRNPLDGANLVILGIFACGCVAGLLSFSRVLHFFLSRYHALTIACLTGVMLGAARKVWPWKEVVESVVIRGKAHVLVERNVLPPALDGSFFLAVALMAAGAVLVLGLERFAGADK